MSITATRREFVKLGAAGLAAMSQSPSVFAQHPGPVTVQQSSGSKRFLQEKDLKWRAASELQTGVITVDPSRTYQEILGFGAAMTDAATYMVNQLSPAAREKWLRCVMLVP